MHARIAGIQRLHRHSRGKVDHVFAMHAPVLTGRTLALCRRIKMLRPPFRPHPQIGLTSLPLSQLDQTQRHADGTQVSPRALEIRDVRLLNLTVRALRMAR